MEAGVGKGDHSEGFLTGMPRWWGRYRIDGEGLVSCKRAYQGCKVPYAPKAQWRISPWSMARGFDSPTFPSKGMLVRFCSLAEDWYQACGSNPRRSLGKLRPFKASTLCIARQVRVENVCRDRASVLTALPFSDFLMSFNL